MAEITLHFVEGDSPQPNGSTKKALREFRREVTLANYPKGNDVLIMNDVSLLDYYHHNAKEDRRRIGDGKGKGYEYKFATWRSITKMARRLGVVHDCLANKNGPDDQDMVDYSDEHLKTQFNLRIFALIAHRS